MCRKTKICKHCRKICSACRYFLQCLQEIVAGLATKVASTATKVARPATFPASTGKISQSGMQLSNNKAEAPGWSFRLCVWEVLFLICPVRTCLWGKGLPTIRVRLSANKPSKQRWHSAKPGACCGWLRHGFRRSHECSSHACQGCAKP